MSYDDAFDEAVSFSGDVTIIRTGLQMAKLRVRGAYLAGRITVEEFEAELGRLLLKEDGLR